MPQLKFEGYVIYNPNTKLYSGGGTSTNWKKRPKIWTGRAHLSNHLNQFFCNRYVPKNVYDFDPLRYYYKGDEIIYNVATSEPIETVDQVWYRLGLKYIERQLNQYQKFAKRYVPSHFEAKTNLYKEALEYYKNKTLS